MATALQNQPAGSTIQESHIYKLCHSVNQATCEISKHREAQTASLDSISEKLQSINNTLQSQISGDIRSATSSVQEISTTLRNSWWPFLIVAGSVLLLPFMFKLLNLAPGLPPSPVYTPTPIPIPVPSPVYTPTPIPIPVPNPVYKPVSSWHVKCPQGYHCLRVRKSPHLSAPIVIRLLCNASAIQIAGTSVDSDGEVWVPIEHQTAEGRTVSGWVVRRFLSS